jgi:hypothetical protein
MQLQRLSTGQQDFVTLRTTDRLYVDKTMFAHQLITNGNSFYFLSRPRRFGKSLFINTLKEIFLGNKQYFKGLFIEDKIEWKTYPVLHFDFSLIRFKEEGLVKAITFRLGQIAHSYQITLERESIGGKFEELILKLKEKTGENVVILIDEYDKPITEYLEFGQAANEQRDILRSFYGIIKGSSAHIRFFFLTGISRFIKVSIFSELNNLTDLSFHKAYHNICGYTKDELESYFHAHLQKAAVENNLSFEELLEQVKLWYNGYSWDGIQKVYNPFSILQFLDSQQFGNYWFESGTPKFLIQLLKPEFRYELKNTSVSMGTFNAYDITNLNIETLLFQTGYLTIKSKDDLGRFILDYPNKEVDESMQQYLLINYSESAVSPAIALNMVDAIRENNIDKLIDTVNTLFASIPAEIFIKNKESYFHSILHISFRLCGFHINSEVRQSKGRVDALLKYKSRVYLFEFKLDGSAESAIAQIKEKAYANAYLNQGLEIYLLGINFSSIDKEVAEWKVEKLEEIK